MSRALSVWWDGGLVGALSLDENGDLAFAYASDWTSDPTRPPVSFSLPKQIEPFTRRQTRPFFAGLLPEDQQREGAARALGVSKENDFGLLEALGGDVAGAITLWPEGEAPPPSPDLTSSEPLSSSQLVEILDTLPRRPLLAGDDGLRLSLAGAQQKLPVVLVDGAVALPAPGQPTTHILKPPIERLAGTTENEAFAMRLAAAIGLDVAPVETRRVGEHGFLLVERYDRAVDAVGRVRRVQQEDFCQALGISPEHKYASEGGPGFGDCFDLVRRACAPAAPSTLRLLDAAIFNVIIGNADAHGKNFSLLSHPTGRALAPLYDLMVTVAYPEVTANFAMRVAQRSKLEDFRPDTWDEFSRDIRVSPPFVRRRINDLAQAVTAQAPAVAKAISTAGFDTTFLDELVATVSERAALVTRTRA